MNVDELLGNVPDNNHKIGYIQGTLMALMMSRPKGDPIRDQLEKAYQYSMELYSTILNANA